MFKKNERIVSVTRDWYENDGTGEMVPCFGPVKDEIYTVKGMALHDGDFYVELNEMQGVLWSSCFFRRLHDETVESIIAQVSHLPVVID